MKKLIMVKLLTLIPLFALMPLLSRADPEISRKIKISEHEPKEDVGQEIRLMAIPDCAKTNNIEHTVPDSEKELLELFDYVISECTRGGGGNKKPGLHSQEIVFDESFILYFKSLSKSYRERYVTSRFYNLLKRIDHNIDTGEIVLEIIFQGIDNRAIARARKNIPKGREPIIEYYEYDIGKEEEPVSESREDINNDR